MYEISVKLVSEIGEERWVVIADPEHIQYVMPIVEALLRPNVQGPVELRIRRHPPVDKPAQ